MNKRLKISTEQIINIDHIETIFVKGNEIKIFMIGTQEEWYVMKFQNEEEAKDRFNKLFENDFRP